MCSTITENTDSLIVSELSARQIKKKQDYRQLRKQARYISSKFPLLDACEFCGSTKNLEHCHLDYINYPEIYVTGCKACHEYADKKNPDTKQLAHDKRLAKMWRYLNNYRNSGFKIEAVSATSTMPKHYRIIQPKNYEIDWSIKEQIIEVVYEPT